VTWRADAQAGDASKLRPDDPLEQLSARLVNSHARKVRHARRGEWKMQSRYRLEPRLPANPSPEAAALGSEEKAHLNAAIAELPPQQARVMRIYLAHDGGTGPEMHEALQCAKGAARMQVSRARQALIELLRRPGTTA
jgi:DNA-directed RNA polymerase specialized sigma24 family protein